MLTRREYLSDASFLVALQGNPALIEEIAEALKHPRWTLYLGRKCCPPSRPLIEKEPSNHADLISALVSVPWHCRFEKDTPPESLDYLVDWFPTADEPEAPDDAEVWYDVPLTFEPPSHGARFVVRGHFGVGDGGEVAVAEAALQRRVAAPLRPRADYRNSEYRKVRAERLEKDSHLCVFCKSKATTVQHVTYRHAGGDERVEELKSLCRLCHDAVTMLEYGLNMGLDRIDPEDTRWRERILKKRDEIVEFRSLETRRRRLEPEEVE
jgi:5-methylcytosine-specific restriction endonuclease McrA